MKRPLLRFCCNAAPAQLWQLPPALQLACLAAACAWRPSNNTEPLVGGAQHSSMKGAVVVRTPQSSIRGTAGRPSSCTCRRHSVTPSTRRRRRPNGPRSRRGRLFRERQSSQDAAPGPIAAAEPAALSRIQRRRSEPLAWDEGRSAPRPLASGQPGAGAAAGERPRQRWAGAPSWRASRAQRTPPMPPRRHRPRRRARGALHIAPCARAPRLLGAPQPARRPPACAHHVTQNAPGRWRASGARSLARSSTTRTAGGRPTSQSTRRATSRSAPTVGPGWPRVARWLGSGPQLPARGLAGSAEARRGRKAWHQAQTTARRAAYKTRGTRKHHPMRPASQRQCRPARCLWDPHPERVECQHRFPFRSLPLPARSAPFL